MNLFTDIQHHFKQFLIQKYTLPEELAQQCTFALNTDPNKKQFGDITTSAALHLAKPLQKSPQGIAQEIVSSFSHQLVEKLEIAGPGFINGWISLVGWQQVTAELYEQKDAFFKPAAGFQKHRYNIEFVSANPTGPLHLGNGRGSVIGDVLGNILRFLGHEVTKEYYINDAGAQIEKLGTSFKARCQQAAGIAAELPEDGYKGEYLIELAQKAVAEYGQLLWQKPASFFADYAKDHLLENIQRTLDHYGVTFDVWFSEKTLHESAAIATAVALLKERNYVYESEDALWFKSTDFGDDKDRVLRKSNGLWTYAAADAAYLLNKSERGFDHLVMVLGHDHHSFAVRLQAMRLALGLTHTTLAVILYQLVTIKSSGQLLKLSKRAGNLVTLHDVMQEVGTDVARFFYLHRKADAQLEFDLDLALKRSEENPVFYVQYAYVRINSILAKAAEQEDLKGICLVDKKHLGPAESTLLKKIASLTDIVQTIIHNQQTHILTYYVIELADSFHQYYALNRVIDLENIPQSRGRLLLIQILRDHFKRLLDLLKISAPEKM